MPRNIQNTLLALLQKIHVWAKIQCYKAPYNKYVIQSYCEAHSETHPLHEDWETGDLNLTSTIWSSLTLPTWFVYPPPDSSSFKDREQVKTSEMKNWKKKNY